MKNKIVLIISILSISLMVFSAGDDLKKDTVLYFEIDIRSESNHPVTMSGIVEQFDYSKLSQKDGESFIASFYSQGYFVPNFLIYDDVLGECIRINEDSTLSKYLGHGQELMNLIAGNGRETKVLLKNGENVFLRITEITGLFMLCSKEDIQLPAVSNEPALSEVEEIVKICVPLDITKYRKPSRKCLKEMMK